MLWCSVVTPISVALILLLISSSATDGLLINDLTILQLRPRSVPVGVFIDPLECCPVLEALLFNFVRAG